MKLQGEMKLEDVRGDVVKRVRHTERETKTDTHTNLESIGVHDRIPSDSIFPVPTLSIG